MDEMINREIEDEGELPFDLAAYELLPHRSEIESFKVKSIDVQEAFSKYLPTVLIINTKRHGTYLWYENLMSDTIDFQCFHVFRPDRASPILDLSFLEFPPVNPKKYHFLNRERSLLFQPEKRKIEPGSLSERFGSYEANYSDETFDWLFVLKSKSMIVYKIEGLRQYPTKNISLR